MDRKPSNADELRRWMSDVESYRDKEMRPVYSDDDDPGETVKMVIVDYEPEDRVRLKGGEDGWGWVTGVVIRPSGVLYQVAWPAEKRITDHWGFELEEAE